MTINLSALLTFFVSSSVINWLLGGQLGGRSLARWFVHVNEQTVPYWKSKKRSEE